MFLLVSGGHVGAHLDGLQHGVSIQISTNLGKKFLRVSCLRKIAQTWILARVFAYLLSFFSQIRMVLISILLYFDWRDTSNSSFDQKTEISTLFNLGLTTKFITSVLCYGLNWSDCLVAMYIEDITCPRVDMNFIFEWSTRYLTSERSERVRYRVDHGKIKFISISGHVMFCLLYKHQWNTKPFYFNIFNGLKVERVVTKHGRSTWTKTKFIW